MQDLPDDTLSMVSVFLTNKELSNTTITSKQNHNSGNVLKKK